MVRVQEQSRAAVLLPSETLLRLDQKTTITFNGIEKERTSLLDLLKGAIHFFSRIPRALKVATPFVNGTVEGTEFFVRVEPDHTFIAIFEGRVVATNTLGSLILTSGQSAVAEAGKEPVLRVVVGPRDAVRWALYYPPIVEYRTGDFPTGTETDWQGMVRRSIQLYWDGDLVSAFSSLAGAPEAIRDPRFFTYRAALLLSVGRVDEAEVDIQKALKLDASNSHAFALQAIIAMVQNMKDLSLELAEKAVALDPESSVARVALSYAKQAHFDLEGALTSLQEAVKLDPENALALARLAELWLSLGYLDKALEVAQKTVALNPNLARTQTVLGFAYLTQIKTKESKSAFEKAIQLDQAAPLPRLGLGLAKIRDGDLKEGRGEIEIAASLDPNNSLIRSYLGKAYFEEKRTKLDGKQYEIAKELDPLDPTPWFYDAIRKQTVNRPVEALHDLQKAIELNDNRAVYRSELQLDSDLAARSASIARIYNDLGFQQRGLFEGWMSVNTDPSSFSAHRFLADTYAVLPRHKIARVSELLQSQLLQPLNITPIQPALAESNLFLISAQGAADLSFREFNPLFNRDRVALQASGLYGENDNDLPDNDTWAAEGIVSGIYKKLSFSAGYSQYDTNGFRINNDQEDKIGNVFAQLEITPKTSIQAEYRYRETEFGDLQLRFFQDDFLPNLRQEVETKTARLGFRHAFSPGSDLIGNFQYQDVEGGFRDEPSPVLTIDSRPEAEAYGGELQYLFRSGYMNIVGGAGYFNTDIEDTETTDLNIPPIIIGPPPVPPIVVFPGLQQTTIEKSKTEIDHGNAYLYSYFSFPKGVTLTIGASGDFFDSDSPTFPDNDQFNPKFGIIWNPVPATTLRGAVFRTYRRTLITDQTLEPTQVAGFNQFFDDAPGTEAWRYGGAIDQKFSESIYGGAEFTYRDMKVPRLLTDAVTGITVLEELDWEEKLARAYLFWTPHKWLALSAEYSYERLERAERFADGARDAKTHYFPLGINFFHPSGLSASLKGTYVDQKGSFERQGSLGTFEDAEDDFWVVDAAINYRLPKRYGFITVGATNLFDKEFQFFDSDRDNPRIIPDRFLFARVTLAMP
jgi:tetratricopeptide (TPR) repeat protein